MARHAVSLVEAPHAMRSCSEPFKGCPVAGAGLTASYAGSNEVEVVTSGLSIFLANATGGLPGSGADGTVPFKACAALPAVTYHMSLSFEKDPTSASFVNSITWVNACICDESL